jgi:uncharacterized protein (DUF169 family)
MSKWYKVFLDPDHQMREIMSLKWFSSKDRVKGSFVRKGSECADCVVLKFKNKGDAIRFKLEAGLKN